MNPKTRKPRKLLKQDHAYLLIRRDMIKNGGKRAYIEEPEIGYF